MRQEFFYHRGHGVHGENNLGFSVCSVSSVVKDSYHNRRNFQGRVGGDDHYLSRSGEPGWLLTFALVGNEILNVEPTPSLLSMVTFPP